MSSCLSPQNALEERSPPGVIRPHYPVTGNDHCHGVIVDQSHYVLEIRDPRVELLTKTRFESNRNDLHRITELLGSDAERMEGLVFQ